MDQIKHSAGCHSVPEAFVCPAGRSMHGEPPDRHWWSGWPGAFCMKCGAGDALELCLADSCDCECHEEAVA